MRNLEVWYTRFEIEKLMPELRSQIGGKMRKRLDKAVAKALRRDSVQAFSKLSRDVDGERRIVSDPPLIVRLDDFPDREERDRAQGRRRAASASSTASRCRTSAGSCSTSSSWSTWPARSSASAASARLPGSRCSSAETGVIRSSCRSRRRRPRCWRSSSAGASTATRASASSPASASCRPRATSSSAGSTSPESVFGQARDYYVRQLRDWKGSVVVEAMDPRALERLRAAVRSDARPRPRPLGRPDRDRELPGPARRLRPGRFSRSARRTPSRTTATSPPCRRPPRRAA